MVRIRLARTGGKKKPQYRIVAADQRDPRNGRFIEQLGIYDPRRNPAMVRINIPRADFWLKSGAQASLTVDKLLHKARAAAAHATT